MKSTYQAPEKVFSIPSEWREERLSDLVDLRTSNVDKKSDESEQSVKLCNYVDVYYNDKITNKIQFMEATASDNQIQNFSLRVGDVIITKDSETPDDIGIPAYVEETQSKLVCGYHLCLLRPNSKLISGQYLFYALDSGKSAYQFYLVSNGVTRFGLTYQGVKNIKIAFPSLPEQRQIAAFLDWKTAQIDALIAKKKSLIEKLKEKRLTLITQAVTKGLDPKAKMKDSQVDWLGQVPEHWEVKRLKLVAIENGIQIGPFGGMLTDIQCAEEGDFKLYGQENVLSSDFDKGNRWLSKTQYTNLIKYQVIQGDFLFTRKGSIGGCSIFPPQKCSGIIDSDTIRLRVDSRKILNDFLYYAFKESSYLQAQVESIKRGAILSGLNTSTIENLKVAIPALMDQERIVIEIKNIEKANNRMTQAAMSVITRLTEYRSALITAATSGQIDVRQVKIPEVYPS